ncbi:replication initiation protein [Viridibacillus sp. NPDC093762]|uniref:replication initiation protein n=1 Tax=Viridibacillus sp. NPDC093762 TaxID=3390720 RepID=UPI003D070BEF
MKHEIVLESLSPTFPVAQANDLVIAKHTEPLTLREQKLILTAISLIRKDDIDLKEYEIHVKEFSKLLGLADAKYTEIHNITKGLMKKLIEIPTVDKQGKEVWETYHWVIESKYYPKEGRLLIKFSPGLKPYLIGLRETYTTYKLEYILGLKSTYSIRLYEICKKWIFHKRKIKVELKLLRDMLGATKKSYDKYSNFKKKLDESIDEVNDLTDIHISYVPIKKGRQVAELEFTIKANKKACETTNTPGLPQPDEKTILIENLLLQINKACTGYEIDLTDFIQIYEGAQYVFGDEIDIQKELNFVVDYMNDKTNKIQHPSRFMLFKITEAVDMKSKGFTISFSGLSKQKAQKVALPDWYQERKVKKAEEQRSGDNSQDEYFEAEREKILAKLES